MSDAQINSGVGDVYSYRQPGLTYGYTEENIAGKVDGQEAVKQAIKHILLTERYEDVIYGDGYGAELSQYIGQGIGFVRAGIQDTLREALLQDDRITDVVVNDVTDDGGGNCHISFTVSTIYGDIEDEFGMKM